MVGILVLSGLGAVAITYDDIKQKSINVCFSKPLIKQENEFITIEFDQTNTFLRKQGKPLIPSYIHTFSFPIGTKINKVTCNLQDFQEDILFSEIKPSPMLSLLAKTSD